MSVIDLFLGNDNKAQIEKILQKQPKSHVEALSFIVSKLKPSYSFPLLASPKEETKKADDELLQLGLDMQEIPIQSWKKIWLRRNQQDEPMTLLLTDKFERIQYDTCLTLYFLFQLIYLGNIQEEDSLIWKQVYQNKLKISTGNERIYSLGVQLFSGNTNLEDLLQYVDLKYAALFREINKTKPISASSLQWFPNKERRLWFYMFASDEDHDELLYKQDVKYLTYYRLQWIWLFQPALFEKTQFTIIIDTDTVSQVQQRVRSLLRKT